MKHLVLPALVTLLLAACTSRPSTESNRVENRVGTAIDSTLTTVPAAASTTAAPATSARINSLSLTPSYDWKRVNLGDAFAAAKAPETERPFEEDATHVGYSIEFDNLESVDYQYFTESGKVSGIRVDLYLNNPASVRTYQQDLIAYYNARYGSAQPKAGVYTWQDGTVTLKDVSKAKEYGLVLKIGKVPAAR
ncbi:hypothetical protein J2I47_08655 [Fibrella sp. HMF5335]|uniref:Lipoprotein n=1 Tax=Fibrella rubiginis TaxID=2817060 RepID=A0A939K5L9_9BACT|nr:hypothetical protein [Fibrella rubiginis]MBO0936610.1 hypothetical protein [Fibrella rubiginis]